MPGRVQISKLVGKNKGPARYALFSERDRTLIEEFIDSLGTLSELRRKRYRVYLGKIGHELGKPFEQLTRQDVVAYLNEVNASEFSDDTMRDIRPISKRSSSAGCTTTTL
jgi:hypothetical protein